MCPTLNILINTAEVNGMILGLKQLLMYVMSMQKTRKENAVHGWQEFKKKMFYIINKIK